MDAFITLLLEHTTSAPDAAKVKAAFAAYLAKLKQAD